ncbi:MAG: NifU family protein [Gammaproteobacteria bacterium]|nr:NifU family protein [Gammaproteobacteria bacterium]
MSVTAKDVNESNDSEEKSPTLDGFLKDIQSLESLVADWDEAQRNTVHALTQAHNDLHKEAFSRLIRALKAEPVAMNMLKEAVTDEVIYSVLRHHGILKATIQERLEDALQSVRPYLESHAGNVELVDISLPDTVTIRLLGACDGCPASAMTLSEGIEKAIKDYCPEITIIKKAKGGVTSKPVDGVTVKFVSPFARSEDTDWIFACKLDSIPQGKIKVATIADNEVLLSRFDNKVTCYQNACAHMGMPLDMGDINNGILVCPHHGFEYSLETGECLTAPEVQLHTHAVRIIDDRVEIKLS